MGNLSAENSNRTVKVREAVKMLSSSMRAYAAKVAALAIIGEETLFPTACIEG